ncbi:hypothetical protein K9L05_01590 [Candidatus Babeliales bacterium]|nr:hypothetical protein [Candidatus Babeliales bacterium]MCF7899324.1 hypothetical protein [Candidatus Babeliales bacterium]
MKKFKKIILILLLTITNNYIIAMEDQRVKGQHFQNTIQYLSTHICADIAKYISNTEKMKFGVNEEIDLYPFMLTFLSNYFKVNEENEEIFVNLFITNYERIIDSIVEGLALYLNGRGENNGTKRIITYLNSNEISKFDINQNDPISNFFKRLLDNHLFRIENAEDFIKTKLQELTEKLNIESILRIMRKENEIIDLASVLDQLNKENYQEDDEHTENPLPTPCHSSSLPGPISFLLEPSRRQTPQQQEIAPKTEPEEIHAPIGIIQQPQKDIISVNKSDKEQTQMPATRSLKNKLFYSLVPACVYGGIEALDFYYHPHSMVYRISDPRVIKTILTTSGTIIGFMERQNIKKLGQKTLNWICSQFKKKETH